MSAARKKKTKAKPRKGKHPKSKPNHRHGSLFVDAFDRVIEALDEAEGAMTSHEETLDLYSKIESEVVTREHALKDLSKRG